MSPRRTSDKTNKTGKNLIVHNQNNAQHNHNIDQTSDKRTVFSELVTEEQIQTNLTNNIKIKPLSTRIALKGHKKDVIRTHRFH